MTTAEPVEAAVCVTPSAKRVEECAATLTHKGRLAAHAADPESPTLKDIGTRVLVQQRCDHVRRILAA